MINMDSPFQPGQPVSPEKFKGREKTINEINNYLLTISKSQPQHFFITGKRGMGKTSLATFIADYSKKEYSLVTAHIMNDGVHTIDELIIQIIERILNSIKSEKWSDKIIDFFKDSIESVGIGGINIKFKPSENELSNIKDNFALYLIDLVEHFQDKKGILIIIDDINGLSDTPEFANWYKSFADTMATTYRNQSKIGMILTGYPEKFIKLYEHNPSFNRIFHYYELERLNEKEVYSFYKDIFEGINIECEEDALNFMVKYSSGMPAMMQEIGEATFLVNEDNTISIDDAFRGVIDAGKIIGLKYLKPIINKKIQSREYMSILIKIGSELVNNPDATFSKNDYLDVLNNSETKVFNDFISRAKELKIIESTDKRGVYKFTNNLYPIYFFIKSIDDKK